MSFFNNKWNEYYNDKSVAEINVLCVNAETNKICGTGYPFDGIRSNYEDFYSIYKVRGDRWSSFRIEYMRMYPFPEIKANYYTECYLLYSLAEKFITIGYNEKLHKYYYGNNSITHTRVEKINTVYMIIHYQKWHIPRIAIRLIKKNPRELCRCVKELLIMLMKYNLMKILNISEIKYATK